MVSQRAADPSTQEEVVIAPDHNFVREFELSEGETITISCFGDASFDASFFDRVTFVKHRGDIFSFQKTDVTSFTTRFKAPETDDYYLVLRRGFLNKLPVTIRLKIRRDLPRRS